MTIRKILTLPDPRLRARCMPVSSVNDDMRMLADDMLETMYDAPGIGLAANQIGILLQVAVVDIGVREGERDPLVLFNPQILERASQQIVYEEGCLSIPDFMAEVERADSIALRYLDREGKMQEMHAGGLLAVCIQHEVDHLNGVLFIDYLSRLKRNMVIKRFQKRERERASDVQPRALSGS